MKVINHDRSNDPELIERYNINGPRYTSYPTALQFHEGFSVADYEDSASHSPYKDRSLSLYVHIPFCQTLCYYCACNKIVVKRNAEADDYLELLEKELTLLAPYYEGRKIAQLHWGGGTPTFLNNDQVTRLMNLITERFPLADNCEASIEIDPRTVTPARIEHLAKVGFNRLSLGIQDFNLDVQKAINRIQSFEDTREVLEAARANGFKSISADLIYGLPNQTLASFDKTLDQIVELSPDRISLYSYAHLPDRFPAQKKIASDQLPIAQVKLKLLQKSVRRLEDAGYVYIGMDHFAKPDDELSMALENGTLQRNFQGYSTHGNRDLIALGVSGISQVGNSFSQNYKTLEDYRAAINEGRLPIERGLLSGKDDLIRNDVIKSLICKFTVNFAALQDRHQINFDDYFANELTRLEPMLADGLVELARDEIRVTQTGRHFIRQICMLFDRYIGPVSPTTQYSKAI